MNTQTAVLTIATRLLDPETVVAAAPDEEAASLGNGLAGTALLHARLSHLGPELERAALAHWDAAATEAARAPWRGGGIFGDLGGLTASLVFGSPYLPDPDVTAVATARSVRWLSAFAVSVAEVHDQSVRDGTHGTTWQVYDAVSGLAGIGRVLLAAHLDGQTAAEPGFEAALRVLTSVLIDRGTARPGWWVPAEGHPTVVAARLGPSGAADTGLAHGVAGPLAFLALAHAAGCTVPGQETATRHAVTWLQRWRHADGSWPSSVSGDELDTGCPASTTSRRTAWCYGVPGIARSLLLAGWALGDRMLVAGATKDLTDVAATIGTWDAEGPTLCHGRTGVLRCLTDVTMPAAHVVRSVVAPFLAASSPFVAQHVDHGLRYDRPGFLTGAAGVALALAEEACLPAAPVRTRWDAALLVS
jgi:hypothetical protein